MTETKEIRLTPISNGTVIDHLPPGTALKIIEILKVEPKDAASIAINTESRSTGRKDLIMLENRFLNEQEIEKIGLIAKNATLNTIKNRKVAEKTKIGIPKKVSGIIKCINPKCITNAEPINTKFYIKNEPLEATCYYCQTTMNENDIVTSIKK